MAKGMRVGLIGAGMMGHGIGKNIVEKGHSLAVLAHRNRQPIEDLIGRGATEAKTPRQLAEACDIVITVVTASPQLEEVVYRDDGLLAGAHKGLVMADCTTANPLSTAKIAADLAARGGRFVDIPLTGTPKEAEAGTLTIMAGGDAATLAEIRPVLDCFATSFIHCGGVAAGHQVKLINNFLGLSIAATTAEAFCCAAKAGVSIKALRDVVVTGGVNSGIFQRMAASALENDDSSFKFKIGTAQKDLRYYTAMADALPSTSFIAEAVHQTYILASNLGLADQFVPRLIDALGKVNGVDPRAKP